MQTKISILFYIKRTKSTTDGLAPIYMRVTIDGLRVEISTKRYVEDTKWLSQAGKVKLGSEEAKATNSYLDALRAKVYDYQTELIRNGQPVNTDNMRNKLTGREEKRYSLVTVFEDHNSKMKKLLGTEYAAGTLQRYTTTLKHLTDYMKMQFNVSDLDIRSVNHAFITGFEFYLRSERKCGNNVTVKYIKNFSKIIRICIANEWLTKDPFVNFKSKTREVERVYLNEDELQAITTKIFPSGRLDQVRDIFVFSCFTGLAYADLKKLSLNNVVKGIDGEDWIYAFRQKTETQCNIPILPIAKAILDKYKDDPVCNNKGLLLPVLSNQKMNAYLKEIADLAGITKTLTFHTARHTFATTVTLSNGVPIESVSKMLGHKDLKITQHYAKIVDRKVSEDMRILKEKFKTGNINQHGLTSAV
ncbi:site-specific integrase [Aurantibacillus circumpalustris]|uniref:site-specific integrase n=1 Tax=Aurantibacillus circumpalustris TaxID=3036359 RepID=UPI00295ADD0F|nr:site-specific integrase [Aurantibacillus circumpalustris]